MGILAAVCKQKGADPAEFVAECTAKIRPTLPSKATGEELLAFMEKAVGKIQEQNRPKPSFNQDDSETMPKLSSSHWSADQSPGMGWADEVEEEEKSRGRSYQPKERPRWNANLDQEEDESFIRGAHRDPFLQVLDKLANQMDQPARPAPPAWPVFTDKYQDFPKWRKDISSYLNPNQICIVPFGTLFSRTVFKH